MEKRVFTITRVSLLSVAALLGMLGGCSQPEAEHHTVSWYAEHDHERGTKLTWCADDAARQSGDDCQNAAAAMAGVKSNGRQFHPTLDWGAKNPKPSTSAKP